MRDEIMWLRRELEFVASENAGLHSDAHRRAPRPPPPTAGGLCHALSTCLAPPQRHNGVFEGVAEATNSEQQRAPSRTSAEMWGGAIPPTSYLEVALHPAPLIASPDTFLSLPDGYRTSPTRADEARRQCWQLVRVLAEQGRIDRIVALCGGPGAGKSAWISQYAIAESPRTAFFDDQLHTHVQRVEWLDALARLRLELPCEIVVMRRDVDGALAALNARAQRGGPTVSEAETRRIFNELEEPVTAEGFTRVRVYSNETDDERDAARPPRFRLLHTLEACSENASADLGA